MAWPTSKPDSTAFDADSDRISTSRAELKTMSDAVNDIVDFVDTTGIQPGQTLVYDNLNDKLIPGDAGQELIAGDGISITNPDSAGSVTITNTAVGGTESLSCNSTTGTIGASNKVTLSGDARVVQVDVTSGGGIEKFGLNVDNCDIGVTYVIYVSGNYGQISCRLIDGGTELDSTGGTTSYPSVSDASDLRWAFKVTKVATSNNRFFAEWDGESRVFDI